MKKIISLLLPLAILFSGCSQEELQNSRPTLQDGKIFTASFEQSETRTYVEEGNLLRWNAGDQISLFDGNTLNRQYRFDGETGDDSGTFSIVSCPDGTGNGLNANYAVYPYASDARISENGVLSVILPSEQSYAENSFGIGANTMVGCNVNLVAPVVIEPNAYLAAGSTINQNVPENAFAIARPKQVTKEGYARVIREKL